MCFFKKFFNITIANKNNGFLSNIFRNYIFYSIIINKVGKIS